MSADGENGKEGLDGGGKRATVAEGYRIRKDVAAAPCRSPWWPRGAHKASRNAEKKKRAGTDKDANPERQVEKDACVCACSLPLYVLRKEPFDAPRQLR